MFYLLRIFYSLQPILAMPQRLMPLVVLFLLISFSIRSQSADEAALKALIQAETDDFTKMSFSDLVKKHWIIDDKTLATVTLIDCVTLHMRAKDMLENTVVPDPSHAKVEKGDYVILINGNIATVYHHQVVTITESGQKIKSHELRVCEKVNGQWKFHMSTVQQYMDK